MARLKFHRPTREWVEPGEYALRMAEASNHNETRSLAVPCPRIQRDIDPYESMITGEMITSRSHHRDHLRQHKMVEVGNEREKPPPPPTTADKNAESADVINDIKSAARELGADVL